MINASVIHGTEVFVGILTFGFIGGFAAGWALRGRDTDKNQR